MNRCPAPIALVNRLRKRFRLAVASGSPRAAIVSAITRLGIAEAFDAVVSSESVARGKPSPDVFLLAAELLRIPPSQCLVFEDSVIGCQAACAAGMTCFVVPSMPFCELRGMATAVFSSLAEVTDEHIRQALVNAR